MTAAAASSRSSQLAGELVERRKELACLHEIADLFATPGMTLPRALAAECRLIRSAFQFPERLAVRIEFRGRRYQTRAYRDAGPLLATPLRPEGRRAGSVCVRYVAGPPRGSARPFLDSERRLLSSLARFTEGLVARAEAQHALQAASSRLVTQKLRLERKNVALLELASTVTANRREIRAELLAELAVAALPPLRLLREAEIPSEQRARLVGLVESAILGTGSAATSRMASAHASLSPREAEICNLLVAGSTSKEVAQMLHVSALTVDRHRHNIRRKLGLVGRDTNLVTWLRTAR